MSGKPNHKQDFATVVTLSLIFLLMASWNLGTDHVPLSTWRASDGEGFYIDLGGMENVSEACVLLKRGDFNLEVYTGYPGSWNRVSTASMRDYYRWKTIAINRETRYMRFVFISSSGEIAEIAVSGEGGGKIEIREIWGEDGEDEELMGLIDEREKIECPPTYMSETYFDEIYYVRAAEDYIGLDEPYEWTHPPLGKLIMAAGILAFGYSPFGWRIMGVIFSTLMIPVIYHLGKKMFGTWVGASVSAFLLVFDFMHFTMGRIATAETFVAFFSIMSQLFFFIYFKDVLRMGWKAPTRPLFLAFLFFSLGFSTKWYTLYGFAGQISLLLALRLREILAFENGLIVRVKAFFSHPFIIALGFAVAAASIYLLTFIPYMMIGHTLKDVYDRHWSMYHFHATLKTTHPFSSPWWSWPIILRPMWIYVSELPGGMISTITAMGNPAVWWIGLVSIIYAFRKTFREKDQICSFITCIFFFQWLPYALIPRCLFIYHFYVNVPLLCLATAYFLNKSWKRRRGKMAVLAYLIIVLVLFALYYPVISGQPMPKSYARAFDVILGRAPSG